MPRFSKFDMYDLDKVHRQGDLTRPDSFRAALYSFARSRKLVTRAYISGDTVVFKISRSPITSLPGEPPRGSKSHRKNLSPPITS